MPQSTKFSISGLHTSNSNISGVPEGSLTIAKNIDLTSLNLASCRRGFNERYADLPNNSDRATKFYEYENTILAYYGTTLAKYSGGSWSSLGSLTKPTNALVPRGVKMNESLYLTSNAGLKKLDSITGTLYQAGIPSGLMMELTQSSGTGTAVGINKTVAYRYVLGRYDDNNFFSLGGVSSRELITATGADRNVQIRGYLPTTIDNTYIIQVYRSPDSTSTSPNDELQLCYELPVYNQFFSTYSKTFSFTSVNDSTDTFNVSAHGFLDGMIVRFTSTSTLPSPITAGTDYYVINATTNSFKVSTSLGGAAVNLTTTGLGNHTVRGADSFVFTDITPQALLGATIYTAQSQQTILNDNAEPPLAADIAEFKQHLFFGDVESKHRYNFTVVSVYDGSSAGELRNGDTITISNGVTTEVYTANSTAADVSTKNFKVDQVSASVSTRIDNTIRSFISVVNRGSALVHAYLNSVGDTDLPGKCRLESKTLGSAAFTVVSTRAAAFSPQLTSTATTNQTSKSDRFRNGLMFSKQGLPEAVPIKNQFKVGSSDDPIKRIVPLRDALLIFKQKDGVFILTGDNETNFRVSPLDTTAKIVAPESLAVLNGLVYGLFESGVATVSDTSVSIESDAIGDKFTTLFGTCLDEVQSYAFGIGYETEGLYILSTPTDNGDTFSDYQLIYNVFAQNWWEWDLELGAGFVYSGDGKLYLAHGNKNRVMQENKAYSYQDFADYEGTWVLSAFSKNVSADTTTLTITGTTSINVGDILVQTGVQPSYVRSVNTGDNTVVVDIAQDWDTLTAVSHYKAIECVIAWNPDFAGNPSGMKHYSTCNALFAHNVIQTATLSFKSDINPVYSDVTITGQDFAGAWGYFRWGTGLWGGASTPQPFRVGVPRDAARCNALTIKFTHRIAQSDWILQGLSLDFNPTGTRTAR